MNKNKLRSATSASIVLFALTLFVTACNNNRTDYGSYDTGTTAKAMPPDSSYVNVPVDTNALTKPAPANDVAAQKTMTAESKPVVPANKPTVKKKMKAVVNMPPVAKSAKTTPGMSRTSENIEVAPSYPGGQSAADQYVNNHIEYPQYALDNDQQGTVAIQFTVDENGRVTGAHEVGNKLGSGLDNEAVRVVASMPAWNPATVNGRAVRSTVTLPISFRIAED